MARVPYVPYEEASPEVKELYDVQLALSGRLPNFHQLLGYVPWVYRWWIGIQHSTRQGNLAPDLQRLIHLQTSLANKCDYCATHSLVSGRQLGIPEDKLSALEAGDIPEDLFSERERVLLEWVTAVATNSARRNMPLFAELEKHFSSAEIVEATAIAAVRTFSNLMQEALWTDLEEESFPAPRGAGASGREGEVAASLAWYAGDVLARQLEQQQPRRSNG